MVRLPATGTDARYVYTQATAATTWNIAHGLGKQPSVVVLENAGNEVEGDITYETTNQLKLKFSVPIAGTAYLN